MARFTVSAIISVILVVGQYSEAGFVSNVLDFVAPKRNIEITNWQTEKCEDSNRALERLEVGTVRAFTKENGDIGLTGAVNTTIFLHSPLTVRVTMKRKTVFSWVKLPCIKDFGSCTYDDLCEYGYSDYTPCPPSFYQNRVPCRCPIDKGVYNIPEDVHIPMPSTRWGGIAKGNYRAKVHILQKENEIACYVVYFTLKAAKK